MTRKARRARLSPAAMMAARPQETEYTLWDGALTHFGLRVTRCRGEVLHRPDPCPGPHAQIHARVLS